MDARSKKFSLTGLAGVLGLALVAAPLAVAPVAAKTDGSAVVINEVYLNGGSSGASFTNKYVELYNPTDAAIAVSGLSVQYRSASGAANPTATVALTGSIPAKGTYLVQGSSNAANGAALPTPDASSTSLNLSGSAGTVFLANQTGTLQAPPTGSILSNPAILDVVGWGTSNTFETAATTAASVTTSIARTAGADSDSNSADFAAGAPSPKNAAGEGPVVTEPEPEVPPTPTTPVAISAIQGAGATSPYVDQTITARGIVTANYATGGFDGYYIQTPGTGGAIDLSTHTNSDALFIYSAATAAEATLGSYVEVTGKITEFQGTTEMTVIAGAMTKVDETVAPVTAAAVAVPTTEAGRESLEGMLIAPEGDYTITDNYDTNYYANIVLNPGTTPLYSPTTVAEPGSAEYEAVLADNLARVITLDDGASINFNTNKTTPLPYLSLENPVRIGAAVEFTKPVVLEYRFSAWNFQPTTQLTTTNASTVQPATFENTRTTEPTDVGGDVTLASFNVLNYFSTTGDSLTGCRYYYSIANEPITVRDGCDARGAATQVSLERQQAKIVTAINALDADVVSLEEIENSARFGAPRDEALIAIVAALNEDAGAGIWDYVPSPAVLPAGQEDVIRTAFIFKPAAVQPVGDSVILDDPAFANARQPLAQEFELADSVIDSEFLAIVNHFKSKGSGEGADEDQEDGQGASNASRVAQATALVEFADDEKTARGIDRVFLTGDFNAYLKEDPIDVLTEAGYVDLGSEFTDKETYAFEGAIGSLDHIFASADAVGDVTGVDIWNINSVESIALEYSRYNYNALNLYAADAYRSSDHDPLVVGLDLTADEAGTLEPVTPTVTGEARAGKTLTATAPAWSPEGVELSYQWLRNNVAIEGATGLSYKLTTADSGRSLTIAVTGTKSGFTTATVTSAAIAVNKTLTATPTPKISGTAKVGKSLKAIGGTWKPAGVKLKAQWYRNGVAIAGATKSGYTLTSKDKGKRIYVSVTGSLPGYTSVTKLSSGVLVK